MKIAAKVVENIDDAMDHIRRYGSDHTDCIVTEDDAAADRFFRELDSAILMRNASTQFADGGEFGFGAEIGIATGKKQHDKRKTVKDRDWERQKARIMKGR